MLPTGWLYVAIFTQDAGRGEFPLKILKPLPLVNSWANKGQGSVLIRVCQWPHIALDHNRPPTTTGRSTRRRSEAAAFADPLGAAKGGGATRGNERRFRLGRLLSCGGGSVFWRNGRRKSCRETCHAAWTGLFLCFGASLRLDD